MQKHAKKIIFIISTIILVGLMILLISVKERDEAMEQTKNYLAKTYPMLSYEIQEITSSTDFEYYTRYHGYFKYAITVQNQETNETFQVFYDKKMNRLEDDITIEKEESYLKKQVTPKVEKYVEEHFGETRYTDVLYNMEDGNPMVLIMFEEYHQVRTQMEFDAFVAFLKETVGLKHATVILDYWSKEVVFQTEF